MNFILLTNFADANNPCQSDEIWCGGSTCASPTQNTFQGSDLICEVTQTQTITLNQNNWAALANYHFKELIINDAATLKFRSTSSITANSTYTRIGATAWAPSGFPKGGSGGDGGEKVGEKRTTHGGGGGAGGFVVVRGGFGAKADSSSKADGGSRGTPSLYAGARVRLFAEEIKINGTLSVNGYDGGNGGPGDMYNNVGWIHRTGGGGGAGGSGAGTIYLVANLIDGDGHIEAKGGNGGNGGGGWSNSDGGKAGGGGGAGAGGAGGQVFFVSQNYEQFNEENINVSGGKPGEPGTSKGNPGSPGEEGEFISPTLNCLPDNLESCGLQPKFNDADDISIKINSCNDGFDNNDDGFIDMNDEDCREVQEWDSYLWNNFPDYIQQDWYNRSAPNGTDLVCGDDVSLDLSSCLGESQVFDSCEYTNQGTPDGLEHHFTTHCMGYFLDNINTGGSGGCASYAPSYCIKNSDRDVQLSEPSSYHCVSKELNYESCTTYLDENNCDDFQNMCEPTYVSCSDFTVDNCPEQCEQFESQSDGALQDLGFIIPDGKYACFDNSRNYPDIDGGNNLVSYNNNFSWRGVQEFPGVIMRAYDTFFVSNYDEWYYCDAMGEELFGNRTIPERETLPTAESTLTPLCSVGLSRIIDGDVIDCLIHDEDGNASHNEAYCEALVEDQGANGYCASLNYNEYMNFNVDDPGSFVNECGYCKYYVNNEFMPFSQYFNENPDLFNPNNNWENTPGSGLIDSIFCKANPDECADGIPINPNMMCDEMHDELDYYYPGDSEKICSEQQYCNAGVLVDSYDDQGIYSCCLGQNSFCEDSADLTCSAMGGQVYNENQGEDCLGANTVSQDSQSCCLGIVVQSQFDLIGSLISGDPFVCYAHQDKNFMSECCGLYGGEDLCYNHDNPFRFTYDVLGEVFSLTGAPYHMISSFDSFDHGLNAYRYEAKPGDQGVFDFKTLTSSDNFPSVRGVFSIEGFDYLEFDLLTSNKNSLESFELTDNNNITWKFNFSDHLYKENHRWQRVKLNLNENIPNNFNKKIVQRPIINFVENSNVVFVIDRLFLSVKNPETHEIKNSQTMYCSGDWGEWIDNLDGPTTDRGFFSGAEPRNPDLQLIDYGKYRDACNNGMTTWWTGSACCGDDTHPELNTQGEYWIDTQGACWNGTAIMHDNTLANALSRNYATRSELERSILFHGDKTWICGKDPNNSELDVNFAFNNADILSTTFNDKLAENQFVTPFTIKGKWMCDPNNGWTGIEDINRMHILASFLLQEAKQTNNLEEFTLHCGDMMQTINIDVIDKEKLGAFCAIRLGQNLDFIQIKNQPTYDGNIIVGFESKNLTVDLTDYLNKTEMLGGFTVLVDEEINCENAPTNPTGDQFFTKCDTTSEYVTIYYNKPLKIALISGADLTETSFLGEIWNAFKNFFARIFNTQNNIETDIESSNPITQYFDLDEFSPHDESNNLYISKQGQKQIVAKAEILGNTQRIRADYINLTNNSNVQILADMINQKTQSNIALWSPHGYSQTIYTLTTKNNQLNFNELTSMLRLRDEGTPHNFGTLNACNNILFDDGTRNLASGEQIIIYTTNYSELCSIKTKPIKCYDGQVLHQNNTIITDTTQYYLTCLENLPQNFELQLNVDSDGKVIATGMAGGAPRLPGVHTQTYLEGTQITLEALPNQDFEFEGWFTDQGGLLSETENYEFQINDNLIIYARFTAIN